MKNTKINEVPLVAEVGADFADNHLAPDLESAKTLSKSVARLARTAKNTVVIGTRDAVGHAEAPQSGGPATRRPEQCPDNRRRGRWSRPRRPNPIEKPLFPAATSGALLGRLARTRRFDREFLELATLGDQGGQPFRTQPAAAPRFAFRAAKARRNLAAFERMRAHDPHTIT